MRICFLQHVPFETPGGIINWAKKNGHAHHTHLLYSTENNLPSLDSFDWLIIMGGPMGIDDTQQHPWLIKECSLIQEAIALKKKVTGICLGAQLIAHCLGAEVYTNIEKEIGWFPIQWNNQAEQPLLAGLPSVTTPLHWHGDTFNLPEGCTPLASSMACKQQAFLYRNHVLALQFHLEISSQAAAILAEHCADELSEQGTYIQNISDIMAHTEYFKKANSVLQSLLDNFAAL